MAKTILMKRRTQSTLRLVKRKVLVIRIDELELRMAGQFSCKT